MPNTTENNVHSDFTADQAATLREIARNGAVDDHSIYAGYGGDLGSNEQSNGGFQDVEDPAALLESLASFEHSTSNESGLAVSNDHFASLLQAAGEAAAQTGHDQSRRSVNQFASQIGTTADQFGNSTAHGPTRRKRKRQEDDSFGFITNKHQKHVDSDSEEGHRLAREHEIWGPEDEDEDEDGPPLEGQPIPTADARAIGVHSAAALFRRPSEASKKYTRPPVAETWAALDISPEQYLHLTVACKNYMLDPNHPERGECVGTRARGDTDMVKLKLFDCVKSFLEDEGWGEKYWGENAEARPRKLKFPQMENKIISKLTPLMRRMVTNERQRLYAREARRLAAATKAVNKGTVTPKEQTPHPDTQSQISQAASILDLDPKLDQYQYNIESPPIRGTAPSAAKNPLRSGVASILYNKMAESASLIFHVSIMHEGRRVKPRVFLTPETCPGFSSLVQHVHSIMDDEGKKVTNVQVLGPGGLVDIGAEGSWKKIIATIEGTEWMDGDVKCMVHVE